MIKTKAPTLADAPLEVQLAVELILLLEQQDLPLATVITALEITQRDFQTKLAKASAKSN